MARALLCCMAFLLGLSGALAEPVKRSEGKWQHSARSAIHEVLYTYGEDIVAIARANGQDPELATAILITETLGNPWAKNGEAEGLMQTTPLSDADVRVECDSYDPFCSLVKGILYKSVLEKRYGLRGTRKILAYNIGPSAARFVEIPEESSYVTRVLYVKKRIPKKALE